MYSTIFEIFVLSLRQYLFSNISSPGSKYSLTVSLIKPSHSFPIIVILFIVLILLNRIHYVSNPIEYAIHRFFEHSLILILFFLINPTIILWVHELFFKLVTFTQLIF